MKKYEITCPALAPGAGGASAAASAAASASAASIVCEEPETHFEKMRGLLGRGGLARGRVLLLRDCRLIHTFGMRFALDVVFAGKAGEVVKVVRGVPPGRVVFGGWRARHTFEAQAGWLPGAVAPGAKIMP